MKLLTLLLTTFLFISCEEESSQNLFNEQAPVESVIAAVDNNDDIEEVEIFIAEESIDVNNSDVSDLEVVKKIPQEKLEFEYNEITGECVDFENGALGTNTDDKLECGDKSHTEISGIDIEAEKPYGLDLRGSTVLKSQKIRISDLYKYEILFDESTVFEKRKNFVKRALKNFAKRELNLEKRKIKFLKNIEKKEALIQKYKEKIAQGVSEKREMKLNSRIQTQSNGIEKLNKKLARIEVKLNYLNLMASFFLSEK